MTPTVSCSDKGLASMASGLFGGMLTTGAIARTAVNDALGCAHPVAAIVHSLLLLGVVYLATGPVSAIPLAALAADADGDIVPMISGSTVLTILRSTRADALTFALTAAVTVCFDLIEAVEIGILVAAFFALRTVARSSVTRRNPGPAQPGDERIALLRLDGAMFFGAAERISTTITDPEQHDVRVVIIRMSQLGRRRHRGEFPGNDRRRARKSRGITVIIRACSANTSTC